MLDTKGRAASPLVGFSGWAGPVEQARAALSVFRDPACRAVIEFWAHAGATGPTSWAKWSNAVARVRLGRRSAPVPNAR